MNKMIKAGIFASAFGLIGAPIAPALAVEGPSFSLPLNCASSDTRCLLQNLVDMDLGERRLDAFCGSSTYNGHKGTDIRVDTIPTMQQGVPILAMADGKVVGMRDGVSDVLVESQAHKDAIKNIECGNGALIDHGVIGGKRWTTQYCHMAKGSMKVRQGQTVKRGQNLGDMGLSGFTTFPHIHVTVRANRQIIDPFTSLAVTKNPACEKGKRTALFADDALKVLMNDDSPLISQGFSASTVTSKQIMRGEVQRPKTGTALVYYVTFKNLRLGDKLRLTVLANGKPYSKNTTKRLRVDKASYTVFAGRKSGGKPGITYQGRAEIIRRGDVVFKTDVTEFRF